MAPILSAGPAAGPDRPALVHRSGRPRWSFRGQRHKWIFTSRPTGRSRRRDRLAKTSGETQRAQAAAQQQEHAQQVAAYRQWLISQGKLVEYKVETRREKLVGDKIDHTRLDWLLSQYAGSGWTLKSTRGSG
jgi:hypothetical protein